MMAFAIRQLDVKRYRSLQAFSWKPQPGLNVLVGSADGGKSTILSAIALLLAQGVPGPRSEFDYYKRNVTDGFTIEAVVGDIDFTVTAAEGKQLPLFGLADDGTLHDLAEGTREPVIRVRATGTADLEVVHEMLVPSGDPIAFGLGLRRRIGLLRITDDSSSVRALRISPGSLLGRQFDMTDLRGSVRQALADVDNALPLSEAATQVVDSIEASFRADGLPDDIDLGLVSPQGADLISMVELVRGTDAATAVPVGLSGSGTRALMTLNVLARAAPEQALVLFEEPERGLEPFSQRIAATRLLELSGRGQTFITTHSPVMLEAMADGHIWRVEPKTMPIALSDAMIVSLMKMDAEAIFSPIALICEGVTECGFLSVMLPVLTGKSLHALGIRLVDGQGQPGCLDLAEKLADAGMAIGLFVDNEAVHVNKRNRVAGKTKSLVWNTVTNIEDAVATYVPYGDLPRVIAAAARKELRYALCEVRDLLPNKTPPTPIDWESLSTSHPEKVVRQAISSASGRFTWYKTFENGAALARALIDVAIPVDIRSPLELFAQSLQ
jgi:putative ATP-dependent endonuclease of the OLD family